MKLEGNLIGSGSEYAVYALENDPGVVLKAPHPLGWRRLSGRAKVRAEADLKHLADFRVPRLDTDFLDETIQLDTGEGVRHFDFGLLQERVPKMRVVRESDFGQKHVREQVLAMLERSAAMVKTIKHSLDFTGQEGLRRFASAWAFQRPIDLGLHNFHLDDKDQVKLVDTGLFRFDGMWPGNALPKTMQTLQHDLLWRVLQERMTAPENRDPRAGLIARSIPKTGWHGKVAKWAFDASRQLLPPR